jgi:hypothetical protein
MYRWLTRTVPALASSLAVVAAILVALGVQYPHHELRLVGAVLLAIASVSSLAADYYYWKP